MADEIQSQTNPFSKFSDGTNEFEVKDAAARRDISNHADTHILGNSGVHGLRYYQGKLAYEDGEGQYQEIQTGAGVIEVTQAQYDALSPAEKNKDVIYVITDSSVMPADNTRIEALEEIVGDTDISDVGNTVTESIVTLSEDIDSVNDPKSKTTTFNQDGSITETSSDCTVSTVFNPNGSITETFTYQSGKIKVKTTTFSGSTITETVVDGND